MGSSRKRRRKRQSIEARVERAGHVALTTIWSAVVRGVGRALRWAGARGAEAGRWALDLSLGAQLLLVAGVVAVWLGVSHYLAERPVYVSDDTEALARVIHSECGSCSTQQQLHIAWATRNLAAYRNESIAEMVCSPCGPQQRGRPVSSRQSPDEGDRLLARYVLDAPDLTDPTGGARHFINPRLQDELAASGRAGYRGRPYSVVRRRWMRSYGWVPYYRLGPDLELWGPKRRRR